MQGFSEKDSYAMNQNLFEMYIGVTINFQKEPDYEY